MHQPHKILATLHLLNHWMTSVLSNSSTPLMTLSQHAQHASACHHFYCGYFHHSYAMDILFLLSYTRWNSYSLDILTSFVDCDVYSTVKLVSISPNASRVTGPCAPVDKRN